MWGLRFYWSALLAGLFGYNTAAQTPSPKRNQPAPLYQAVDTVMQHVPDSAAHTVGGLGRYIRAAFSTEADRARAAFVWVASSIRYDVPNQYTVVFRRESAEVVQEALMKRLGVCQHYAELYNALATEVGLQTHVVRGYTKRYDGALDPISHAWCATRINGTWYLMDPTWGAGHIAAGAFVPQLNNEYFRAQPASFICTHMPYDLLWQLQTTPHTAQQFRQDIEPPKLGHFNFSDSIAAYEQQPVTEQLHATNRRIKQNGVDNELAARYLANSLRQEDNLHLAVYNTAVKAFNEGNNKLNRFLDFFNHRFLPPRSDADLRQMLPSVNTDFTRSRALLSTVHIHEAVSRASIRQLETSLQEAETKLRESNLFLNRYLQTQKVLRHKLFLDQRVFSSQY